MHITSWVTIDTPWHREDRMRFWNLAHQMPTIAMLSHKNCCLSESVLVRPSSCGILRKDSATPCFSVETQRSPEPDGHEFRPPEISEIQVCVTASKIGSTLVQVFAHRIFAGKADQVTSVSPKVPAEAVGYYSQKEGNSKAATSRRSRHSHSP